MKDLSLAYAMKKKKKKSEERDSDAGVGASDYSSPGERKFPGGLTAKIEGPKRANIYKNDKWVDLVHPGDVDRVVKANKYAQGGQVCAHGGEMACNEGCYSKGGAVKGVHEAFDGAHDMNSKGGQSFAGDRARWASSIEAKGTKAKYGEAAKLEHKKILEELRSMKAPNLMAEGGEAEHPMLARIMAKRGYSEGGQVANDVEPITGEMPANFDDLALRDDLEFSYTGRNSGDELGNEQLEHDDKDIVARIMRSRAKKDRMPHPA